MGKDWSSIGRALAAPARSAIIDALMDGSRRPASELAQVAGVTPATASEHLAVLVDARLLAVESRGRHRFYRLAGTEVAEALERLGPLCPDTSSRPWRRTREAADLAAARLCYDHLAGRLGVALADGLVAAHWLDADSFAVLPAGQEGLAGRGIAVDRLSAGRRLSFPCFDWTQRRTHLAGALGAAVATRFLEQHWVRRRRTGRGLDVTKDGRDELATTWSVPIGVLSGLATG